MKEREIMTIVMGVLSVLFSPIFLAVIFAVLLVILFPLTFVLCPNMMSTCEGPCPNDYCLDKIAGLLATIVGGFILLRRRKPYC